MRNQETSANITSDTNVVEKVGAIYLASSDMSTAEINASKSVQIIFEAFENVDEVSLLINENFKNIISFTAAKSNGLVNVNVKVSNLDNIESSCNNFEDMVLSNNCNSKLNLKIFNNDKTLCLDKVKMVRIKSANDIINHALDLDGESVVYAVDMFNKGEMVDEDGPIYLPFASCDMPIGIISEVESMAVNLLSVDEDGDFKITNNSLTYPGEIIDSISFR